MKRKLKATPRFIMLLTLICLIFAGAVILSQQAKLNEIAAKQAALDEQYAALQAEEQRLEYMIEYAKSDEYRVQYAREKLGLCAAGRYKVRHNGLRKRKVAVGHFLSIFGRMNNAEESRR